MRGIAVSFQLPLILVSTERIQHACHRQPLPDRRLVLRGLLHGRRLGARSVARRADPVPRLSHGLRDETEPSHEGRTPWLRRGFGSERSLCGLGRPIELEFRAPGAIDEVADEAPPSASERFWGDWNHCHAEISASPIERPPAHKQRTAPAGRSFNLQPGRGWCSRAETQRSQITDTDGAGRRIRDRYLRPGRRT